MVQILCMMRAINSKHPCNEARCTGCAIRHADCGNSAVIIIIIIIISVIFKLLSVGLRWTFRGSRAFERAASARTPVPGLGTASVMMGGPFQPK